MLIRSICFGLALLCIPLLFGCDEDDEPTGSGSPVTVTDIDGNVYQTVRIGDQLWMAENLRVTHYRNGDPILHVTDNAAWFGLLTGAYCSYDNDEGNVAAYGRLYNRYVVEDSQNIAPEGWHVPNDADWKQLEMYLGMSQSTADGTQWRGTDEGGKLKEAGIAHWSYPNEGATNESGFTALPGGYRLSYGDFREMDTSAHFWSFPVRIGDSPWNRRLHYTTSRICRDTYGLLDGYSVRCVKD